MIVKLILFEKVVSPPDSFMLNIFCSDLSDFEILAFGNSYNIKPQVSYSFSKYVDRDLWLNYIVSETHTNGRKKETDVGFKIRIYFESF